MCVYVCVCMYTRTSDWTCNNYMDVPYNFGYVERPLAKPYKTNSK